MITVIFSEQWKPPTVATLDRRMRHPDFNPLMSLSWAIMTASRPLKEALCHWREGAAAGRWAAASQGTSTLDNRTKVLDCERCWEGEGILQLPEGVTGPCLYLMEVITTNISTVNTTNYCRRVGLQRLWRATWVVACFDVMRHSKPIFELSTTQPCRIDMYVTSFSWNAVALVLWKSCQIQFQ